MFPNGDEENVVAGPPRELAAELVPVLLFRSLGVRPDDQSYESTDDVEDDSDDEELPEQVRIETEVRLFLPVVGRQGSVLSFKDSGLRFLLSDNDFGICRPFDLRLRRFWNCERR